MFVKERMSVDVVCAAPEDSVSKAFGILKDTSHSQLPVVDKANKLIGLVTEKLLTEVSPSKATSLSVFEINYLLSKSKIKDVMETNIFTTTPKTLIEDAALVMKTNDIGSLPVVNESRKLVGIITKQDIFSAFIDIMGVNDFGARIVLKVEDKLGTFADISSIIKEYGINITHVSNYTTDDGVEIMIKLNTIETDEIVKTLEKHNYKVLSVAVHKNSDRT